MLPQQRTELIAALDADDDVKAVTIALSIAAQLARTNKRLEAMQIRDAVDVHQARASDERAYRVKRLDIAAMFSSSGSFGGTDIDAINWSDSLMAANASAPIPNGAIP